MMRRLLPWLLLALLAAPGLTNTARAQTAPPDSSAAQTTTTAPDVLYPVGLSDRVTTVPLPNGRGVFYFRSGKPGGVRIRSRPGTRRSTSDALPEDLTEEDLLREAAADGEPLSRVDLLRMELALRRDLDSKLGQLIPLLADRGRSSYAAPSGSPSYVLPSGQAPGTFVLPQQRGAQGLAPTPSLPTGGTPSLGVSAGPATVEEVERAILETGLFRTTTVNFEFDRSVLLPSAQRTLDVVGEVLTRYPDLFIAIAGYTDDIGSEAYNLQLSQRRAEAVREYLLRAFPTLGPARIEAHGYGESQPIVPNTNPTTRTLNRRVEFIVLNPEAAEGYRAAPAPATDREVLRRQLRELIDEELQHLRQASPADTTGGG